MYQRWNFKRNKVVIRIYLHIILHVRAELPKAGAELAVASDLSSRNMPLSHLSHSHWKTVDISRAPVFRAMNFFFQQKKKKKTDCNLTANHDYYNNS